jgi:hypothetical protein
MPVSTRALPPVAHVGAPTWWARLRRRGSAQSIATKAAAVISTPTIDVAAASMVAGLLAVGFGTAFMVTLPVAGEWKEDAA